MSSQLHLQIFTPSRGVHDYESKFSLFPLLPKEIRLKIWQHSLQCQRIIKLRLKSRAIESIGVANYGERYCAVVYEYQVLSKLLRVNSESRDAALNFYRVHLPCRFTRDTTWTAATTPGTLHVNPEYDFLQIHPEWPVKDTLVDFLYHLKTTLDPRGVGLLNLAVDINALNGNDLYKLEASDLDPAATTVFVATLAQLCEVFFVSISRVGRQILPWQCIPTSDTIFNRSFPIIAMTPTFERLHRDPRPITQDLRQIFEPSFDPRHTFRLWQQLLKKWGASPPKIEYRLLLAFEPTSDDQIFDRGSAKRWLQKEDDAWTGKLPRGDGMFSHLKFPIGAEHEKYRNEDLERAVKPAFGFWLFPVEALGALEEGQNLGQALDLTEHWPELALSSFY